MSVSVTRWLIGLKRMREAAAESAAVCADCFQPLPASMSVALVWRFAEKIQEHDIVPGFSIGAHDRRIRVPICLPCWPSTIERAELAGFTAKAAAAACGSTARGA